MMDLSDGLYIIAGMFAGGAVVWWYLTRSYSEMTPMDEPFVSVWEKRGYDDWMLDRTYDPSRTPEGQPRTDYKLGNRRAYLHDDSLQSERPV